MDKKIFIVDDDPVYLDFMMGHFRKMNGYSVYVFSGGEDALANLIAKKPDLIILDHHLDDPKKDGLFFISKFKKYNPKMPILYITSNDTEAVKLEALKAGAKSVIVKSDSFLVQLRTALDDMNAPKKGFFSKLFK
jgi:DNA-binding response OmpR family regulator